MANDPRTQSEKLALFDLTADPQNLANVYRHNLLALVYYALPPAAASGAYAAFLNGVESTRLDQQLGATSANAVTKAGITSLMSLALETGVLTETTDQNLATLHANGDGLMRFLTNRDVVPLCASGDAACQPGWAKDLDLSASFSGHRFESATVSYAIANSRDIRSPGYRAKWLAWFEANHAALGASGQDLLAYVGNLIAQAYQPGHAGTPGGRNLDENVSRYDAWREDTEAAIAATPAGSAERAPIFAAQLDRLIALMRQIDPQFDAKLADLESAYMRYFATRAALASSPIASLITEPEWLMQATYSEPSLAPKVINARLVYAQSPQRASSNANPGTVTANIGIDLYQVPQLTDLGQNIAQEAVQNIAQVGALMGAQRMSRFRDAQAAIQFDRSFGGAGSPAAFSIAAYYQYQPRPGILLEPGGGEAWAPARGSLFLVQAGITLTIAGSGMKVPIGVSWSNRTDLGPGQEVRAHVGFTFDSGGLVVSK